MSKEIINMGVVYLPYHDWRKIQSEGNRTRDAHFIEAIRANQNLKMIVVNRPITLLELIVKKKTLKAKLPYEVIYQNGNYTLYKLDESTFLIDSTLKESFTQLVAKRSWFFFSLF